jgi:hypothetical protein
MFFGDLGPKSLLEALTWASLKLFFSFRHFQLDIVRLKRRSYEKVTTPGS